VAVLTQPGVGARSPTRSPCGLVRVRTVGHVLPDREEAKELDTVGTVYDALAEFNLGRHDTIVGVGGGAATDVAGFAAATWLRGVESVLVPTTLAGGGRRRHRRQDRHQPEGQEPGRGLLAPIRVVIDLDVLAGCPSRCCGRGRPRP
jgi:glycerol dehydrogenase-like iron-containing ADH family enzyme